MKKWLSILFVLCAVPAWADTHAAASCSRADVATAVAAASDGDTVTIPAGSCTWTSGITVADTIGITVSGNGTPTSDPDDFGASASCTGTTITLTGAVAFSATPAYGASTLRFSCMQLTYGSGASAGFSILGACTSSGCPNLRIDNITFTSWAGHSSAVGLSYAINGIGDVFGVMDHNTVTGAAPMVTYLQVVQLAHASYMGVGHYGDKAWAMAEEYGSEKFFFFENNVLSNAGLTEHEGSLYGLQHWGGGRPVARFNQFTNMDVWNFAFGWHGTESGGRPRGFRTFEAYGNTHTCVDPTYRCAPLVSPRSGTGLAWGNTSGGAYGLASLIDFTTYRQTQSMTPWGACDGASTFDTNEGGAFWSGTISSASYDVNTSTWTIGVSGTPWTVGQWTNTAGVPYSLHDVTINNGSEIVTNGTNYITVKTLTGPGSGPSPGGPVFATSDSIQIRKATACLDQGGGRGAGVLYADQDPPAAVAAEQVLSPSYLWSNTFNVTPANYVRVVPATQRVIRNREYYVEEIGQAAQTSASSPFDGTTTVGMGHGTLANRPTTCTTGVGYWATDQGTWNTSGNSFGQGRLYLCTATNTWTLSYTPYTYPHPLVSGAVTTPPTAPTNVRIR